ncbi:hypothetical protein LCGC14_1674680 [marine sediment metagenome]|uniref:Uncharacterized protein n=1 Tax=marine sediment metagenome TaxID=412755 RepID=A0A0F9K674_9ZZZZ
MKYNTLRKRRELWNRVRGNNLKVQDLKKIGIQSYSITYTKNIYNYQTEWDSWLNLPCPTIALWETTVSGSQAFMVIIELKDFPDNFIPFIEVNLIAKTITDNAEYVEKFDTLIVDTSNWYYSYIIKKEEETDGESAQDYKDKNGEYPGKYYLISYIYLEFKEGDDDLPLEYKQLITINNPKFDEIRTNKS